MSEPAPPPASIFVSAETEWQKLCREKSEALELVDRSIADRAKTIQELKAVERRAGEAEERLTAAEETMRALRAELSDATRALARFTDREAALAEKVDGAGKLAVEMQAVLRAISALTR